MIILSRPSISPYLARTLFELEEPVVLAESMNVPLLPSLNVLQASALKKDPKALYRSLILTSSENSLSTLYQLIPHDDRVMKAQIFKDKAAFRRSLSKDFPRFYFREANWDQLLRIEPNQIPFPVILKPSIGISSIGVIRVGKASEWKSALQYLKTDLEKYQKNYSANVVEGAQFIIEKFIRGPELAIDGYFDSNSEPVVLNILEHLFENDQDTSDRIYYTRRSLIQKYLEPVQDFLKKFGDVFDLKRFPFHLELRADPKEGLIPIELNPLRFAGLGTCELAEYAYGINVYKYFFRERRPDWDRILSRKDDSVFTFMCADLPTELFRKPGLKVNDRGLTKEFKEVLDYRILDEEETSTFAVVFFRDNDLKESKRFLKMDFSKFFEIRKKVK